jgi:hypothetical protein
MFEKYVSVVLYKCGSNQTTNAAQYSPALAWKDLSLGESAILKTDRSLTVYKG